MMPRKTTMSQRKRKNDSKIFCENIADLRKKEGLSLVRMASELHISVKSLKTLEAGTMPPMLSAEILFTIQESFGVTPADMFSPTFFHV